MVSPATRFKILDRDDFTCRYCGRRAPNVILEVDHVIPRSRGGTNHPSNLVASCYDCNNGKKDKVVMKAVPKSELRKMYDPRLRKKVKSSTSFRLHPDVVMKLSKMSRATGVPKTRLVEDAIAALHYKLGVPSRSASA